MTLGQIGALNFDCLIFDDLNEIEDGSVQIALTRCVQALGRRHRGALVTAYRRPSQKAMNALGLDAGPTRRKMDCVQMKVFTLKAVFGMGELGCGPQCCYAAPNSPPWVGRESEHPVIDGQHVLNVALETTLLILVPKMRHTTMYPLINP